MARVAVVEALDHAKRAIGHYGQRKASLLAAAATYFAFLSFFPILALAFAAVGVVSHVYPGAVDSLETALRDLLPGMIGDGPHQLSIAAIRGAAGTAAGIGLVTVLYSGIGWVSGMRSALGTVFDTRVPESVPSVVGKARRFLTDQLRDVLALIAIGAVLLVSVGASGAVTGFAGSILDALGLDRAFGWLLAGGAIAVGLLANAVLFLAMFRLLAKPTVSWRALAGGAALGAVGFQILTQASRLLLRSTSHQPAFQAFGIALILLVWIYYTQRLVLFAAAWAATADD